MNQNSLSLIVLFLCSFCMADLAAQNAVRPEIQTGVRPNYKRTNYSNQSILLKNDQIRLQMFRRIGGWGWGEISAPSGKLMAVLDHLGEIMLRDQDIPMRFEADSMERKMTETGEALIFKVQSVVARKNLKGTSFEEWMHYPYSEPAITGEVTITLAKDKPLIYMQYRLKATGNYYARYIRGPWLKVGEASFGTQKDDSMLPGVDWPVGEEWSSGIDWFKDPWACGRFRILTKLRPH